jgi:hypothetical protein
LAPFEIFEIPLQETEEESGNSLTGSLHVDSA